MAPLHLIALIAALLSAGLMAGLFTGYSYSVMPGLKILDDRAWIAALQHINRVIINGRFMTAFLGSVVFALAAVILGCFLDDKSALPWTIAGLVCNLVMFIGTMAKNVPLNDRLEAAGDPAAIEDPAALRGDVEEPWTKWNHVRGIASLLGLAALAWALYTTGLNA
ncbi:anthrone oxygenase family protein [Glycomyces sp. MUSA5-2]|uniref:anthrone oxygenase family protein n=1 Tax=Glycomyces sp. MUSA5-2 TaxID=2053002 RepID=UPI003009C8ED